MSTGSGQLGVVTFWRQMKWDTLTMLKLRADRLFQPHGPAEEVSPGLTRTERVIGNHTSPARPLRSGGAFYCLKALVWVPHRPINSTVLWGRCQLTVCGTAALSTADYRYADILCSSVFAAA